MGFLAGANGWNITNVAAFSYFLARLQRAPTCIFLPDPEATDPPFSLYRPDFQHIL